MTKKLPKRLLKQATRAANELLDNAPTTTFLSLWTAADAMEYGSDEKKLADAVVAVLEQNRATAWAESTKLLADLENLGLSRLVDGCAVLENVRHEIAVAHNCIAHESEYTRHMKAIVANNAEEEGIDINGLLGYVIY